MSARILLAGGGTGGHLYPALNLAAALRAARPDVELMLVGASRGVEASVLPTTGVPYRLLPMEPFR
ncbi:MAG: glycosyltransferase, partial [Gemmatimonadota bacterium]